MRGLGIMYQRRTSYCDIIAWQDSVSGDMLPERRQKGTGELQRKWTKAEESHQSRPEDERKEKWKRWKWGPPLHELAITMSNKTMQSGSWCRVAVSAEGDTVMELTTTVIASTWPLWPPRHWLLIRSGDMKARTNEGGQITINQTTTADTEIDVHTNTTVWCYWVIADQYWWQLRDGEEDMFDWRWW